MYHLELRQFPKRVRRFNLDGPAIGAIVLPWVQEKIVELGEQKWSPHQATLIILEGPEIPLEATSMERGWRTAEREGTDVTATVLAEAREAVATGAAASVGGGPAEQLASAGPDASASPPGDPLALGVELGALLGSDPSRLLSAWRAVAGRSSGLSPSEALALAEREIAREA